MGHNREDPMTAPKWPTQQQQQQFDMGECRSYNKYYFRKENSTKPFLNGYDSFFI